MVFKDLDKTHKQVQVAYASLVNNYAVLFKGQPVPESAWSAILASSVALFKTFNEQSDVQAMYRLCAGVGTFVDGNVTRIQAATALKVPGLAREQVLESDAVKGGVGTIGDPKTQRCCYALLETLSVAQYLQPGLKVADNDAEFEKIVKYAGGKAVIVDFAASWCGPCKVIGPIFDQLAEETPQAVFVKVDVDQCRSTATKFKVEAMPTFKLLHMGREMASIQGANEAGLKELVAKVVAASGGGGGAGGAGAGGARAGVDAGDVDQ
jgi:thioredoxin